ncbi:MAG: acyltransferase family protein [Myxococcales bacterium]|nr:acyltransferase family protein [Myxococcales bacterium]
MSKKKPKKAEPKRARATSEAKTKPSESPHVIAEPSTVEPSVDFSANFAPAGAVEAAERVEAAESVPPESGPKSTKESHADDDTAADYGADLVAEISAYVPDVASDDVLDAPAHAEGVAPRGIGGDVGGELRAVEAEVDRILHEHVRLDEPPGVAEGLGLGAAFRVVERLREAIPVELPGEQGGTLVDAAKDVLSTDYYLRQWGRLGLRNRSEEVDEFGLDPVYEARFRPFFDLLYKYWFRVEVEGLENVPDDGRCILVGNHSGVLPYDGIMVRTAVRRAHPAAREVRWLAEDFVYHLPFLGAFMNRIGAVRACQENAERLLEGERCVLVFPEGIKGIGKLWRDRYQLQRFGRGGFVKLALRTGAPIVPVAIVGAEESAPMLYKVEYLTEALGLPFVPVTPGFPIFGPLGFIPAPTKWRIKFLPAVDLEGSGPESADDALLVNRLAERVRGTIQESLDKTVATRKSVFF